MASLTIPKLPAKTPTRSHEHPPIAEPAVHTDLDERLIGSQLKENTAWDIYNNEAKKVDDELVKDWTASLNFLLGFVSNSFGLIGF